MTSIEEKIIKPKLGLLELAKRLGSISEACKTIGYSRDSFYRFKKLYENGGEEALKEISHKKPIFKNRIPDHIEQAVIGLAIENPALGQVCVSQELLKQGIIMSPGGLRSKRSYASPKGDANLAAQRFGDNAETAQSVRGAFGARRRFINGSANRRVGKTKV